MRVTVAVVLAIVLGSSAPARVDAQGLSVDVSAGRLVYEPVSANVGTNNLMGMLRYDSPGDGWVYGAAAAPLGNQDTFWGGAGGGARISARKARRMSFGADVGVHGYAFRDAVVDQPGSGGTADAFPFARLSTGIGYLELRGGWRGQTLAFAGVRENRGVFESGAHASYGRIIRIEGDGRWVRAPEGTYPFAGATLVYDGSRAQLWGEAGKWLSDTLDASTWAAGAGVTVGTRARIWAMARQEAPDPLYWNTAQRTWSVGMTQQLGRRRTPPRAISSSQSDGIVIRLNAADAPDGTVSIAGDFNNWQPTPMLRDGGEWVFRIELAPGAYHYAFRSANGEWFVPSSTASRQDDGMGGHVAVVLVS